MKEIGRWNFPETPEEAKTWKPVETHHALAMRVLAVAHTRVEGTWCAYIDAVDGHNHDFETEDVFHNGEKLTEKVALALFPMFENVPYAY